MRCCDHCGKPVSKTPSALGRADREGRKVYCDRVCAGLGRRLAVQPTEAEKKAAKAAYDKAYCERNAEQRKIEKAEYHKRTYNPVEAAIKRKKRMPYHVEYCRRPEYKEYKRGYDKRYNARSAFGDFADAFLILQDLEKEIDGRATRQEIYQTNGTYNKALLRRRALNHG